VPAACVGSGEFDHASISVTRLQLARPFVTQTRIFEVVMAANVN